MQPWARTVGIAVLEGDEASEARELGARAGRVERTLLLPVIVHHAALPLLVHLRSRSQQRVVWLPAGWATRHRRRPPLLLRLLLLLLWRIYVRLLLRSICVYLLRNQLLLLNTRCRPRVLPILKGVNRTMCIALCKR